MYLFCILQASEFSHKNRELRLEITKLTSTLSVLENDNLKLQKSLDEEVKLREEVQDCTSKEINKLRLEVKVNVEKLKSSVQSLEAELQSSKDQLVGKQTLIQKLEQSLASDTTRLEKKLAYQVDTVSEYLSLFY